MRFLFSFFLSVFLMGSMVACSNVPKETPPSDQDVSVAQKPVNYTITPSTTNVAVHQPITFQIDIDAPNTAIIAGKIAIRFDQEFLEIDSKDIDTMHSVFSFWTVKKSKDGYVDLQFGQTNPGIQGNSKHVATITALTKKEGITDLYFDHAKTSVESLNNDAALNKEDLKPTQIRITAEE